jgi:hypothetical protein
MTDERQRKAGDYAALDEPGGWRVLCNRRFPGDRYCDTVLAMIEEQGLGDGRRHRVLYFTHPAWIERHGVWRVATGAKKRLRQGLPPHTQMGIGPYRQWASGIEQVWGPTLPATVECPQCGHRRVLHEALLDALGPGQLLGIQPR